MVLLMSMVSFTMFGTGLGALDAFRSLGVKLIKTLAAQTSSALGKGCGSAFVSVAMGLVCESCACDDADAAACGAHGWLVKREGSDAGMLTMDGIQKGLPA